MTENDTQPASTEQQYMIAEVTLEQAWKMLQENPNAILLDVLRSKVEFDYVGHPVGAVHVPLQEFPDWQTDPDENRHRGNVNGWRYHGLPWEQT